MFHLIWYVLIGLLSGMIAKIGDARPYDAVLDGCGRDHRVDPRRLRHPYVLTPKK
jgi:hypothetical protein